LRYHRGMTINIKELARVGAQARLAELLGEVAEIQRAFPGIGGARRGRPPATEAAEPKTAAKRGRRRKMSAKEKAEVSARMKKYWASRRKEKKAQG
jgi:hypothetical protein